MELKAKAEPRARELKFRPPHSPQPHDVGELMQLAKEPQFVSAAYFLKFKFEQGRYAFAGPETYEGRRVLKIEYYPARLFSDDKRESEEG